jgi:hypothetical protein
MFCLPTVSIEKAKIHSIWSVTNYLDQRGIRHSWIGTRDSRREGRKVCSTQSSRALIIVLYKKTYWSVMEFMQNDWSLNSLGGKKCKNMYSNFTSKSKNVIYKIKMCGVVSLGCRVAKCLARFRKKGRRFDPRLSALWDSSLSYWDKDKCKVNLDNSSLLVRSRNYIL